MAGMIRAADPKSGVERIINQHNYHEAVLWLFCYAPALVLARCGCGETQKRELGIHSSATRCWSGHALNWLDAGIAWSDWVRVSIAGGRIRVWINLS